MEYLIKLVVVVVAILALLNVIVDFSGHKCAKKDKTQIFKVVEAHNDTLDIYRVTIMDTTNHTFVITQPLIKFVALGIDADSILVYSEI